MAGEPVSSDGKRRIRGESRWPMALAVVTCGVLNLLLPEDFRVSSAFAYGYVAFLAVFLAVLVVGDPGRIDRDRPWLRATTGVMIAVITLVTGISTVRLVIGILTNAAFDSAGQLLAIGGIIWVTNVLAFTLWYWDTDAGGAAARAVPDNPAPKSFVFPEMTHPELVPPGWYPQFVDYLALSVNTALAFSPTDVSALRRWAKLLMITQSVESLALAALVISRAINIL